MKPKLNVCFTCVGTKILPSEIEYDLAISPEDWWEQASLAEAAEHAIDLYGGPGFQQVHRIIMKLEEHYEVEPWIFSAGFGILNECDEIPGYDATFSSSAKTNRVRKPEWKSWLTGVSKHSLPKGTVCVFPRSYADPYQVAFGDLDDMILIQGTSEDRKDLGCSMIRVSTTLMEKIVDRAAEANWEEPPEHWPNVRGYEV